MFDFVLRNGKFMTPQGVIEGDLAIENKKIAAVGKVSEKAEKEIDAQGQYVLPGIIDVHVHFRDPGFPQKGDFETESKAAAAGGVTTVFDMPNTDPPIVTHDAFQQKLQIAKTKSLVNFGFYMGLTKENFSEIEKTKNIAGVKIFLGSSTGNLLLEDFNMIEKAFQKGLFCIVHAELESLIRENEAQYAKSSEPYIHSLIRSHKVAYEATKEMLHLAKKYDGRVHITHVSTAQEIAEIAKFKSPKVSCDVTPHHLFLTTKAYEKLGNFVKINPPLRDEEDRQALWKGIRDGIVDCIASDHAPHTKSEKQKSYREAPAGVPGVQTLLPLLLDAVNHGTLSLQQVVKLTAENPAKLFHIQNKGKIEVGYDADLVVIDMDLKQEVTEKMLFYKCGWSPFTGWKLQGWPLMTFVRGKMVYQNGKVIDGPRGEEVYFE